MSTSDKRTPKSVLFLEDLHAGMTFSSNCHTIDEGQIIAFATQFDPQPFHLGHESARGTFFGELVASGWHTAAITMRLLVESDVSFAGGAIGAGAEISWPAPTRPGDILRIEGEIIEVIPSKTRKDRGSIIVKSRTLNQRNETLQKMTARMVVMTRKQAG